MKIVAIEKSILKSFAKPILTFAAAFLRSKFSRVPRYKDNATACKSLRSVTKKSNQKQEKNFPVNLMFFNYFPIIVVICKLQEKLELNESKNMMGIKIFLPLLTTQVLRELFPLSTFIRLQVRL